MQECTRRMSKRCLGGETPKWPYTTGERRLTGQVDAIDLEGAAQGEWMLSGTKGDRDRPGRRGETT